MNGPKLPDIKKEKKNFGWQVNVEASYPEKFWEKVLLNNVLMECDEQLNIRAVSAVG